MKIGNSPIVKCSHCNQILSSEGFIGHNCAWNLKSVKRIPVTYFRDDSYEDKKIMTGYGTDGVLYTFEVVPRKPIPYVMPLSDGSYHDPKPDDKLPEPLDEAKPAIHSIWTDIPPINSMSNERIGFPTQKPIKLLERIIMASSKSEAVVLDPFCGCGTTIMAAQELNRKWIGIDITHLAISLIRARLKKIHVYAEKDYKIIGEPVDLASATKLAEDDKYQFQCWAVSLIDAFPVGQSSKSPYGKKGADKGIDGWLTFREGTEIDLKRIVVQVKGGHSVGAGEVRDLVGTVQNTKSAMGILITLDEPTQPMKIAAMEAGYYESPTWGHTYPKIQISSIPDLLEGKKPNIPH